MTHISLVMMLKLAMTLSSRAESGVGREGKRVGILKLVPTIMCTKRKVAAVRPTAQHPSSLLIFSLLTLFNRP